MSSRSDRSTLLRRDWLNTMLLPWRSRRIWNTEQNQTEPWSLVHPSSLKVPAQMNLSSHTGTIYLAFQADPDRGPPPHTPLWVQSYPPVRPPLPCALPPPPPLPVSSLTRDMSDKAKHPIAPVELTTSTATQKQPPGVQLKVREENVSQGQREGGEGARWR